MTERSAVQNPMLRYAEAIGWRFVSREEALRLRGSEAGRIFAEVLTAQLLRLNPGVVDVTRAGEIVRQLGLLNATIEGNRDALAWLCGERSVFVPEERRERNVRLIDFDRPDANVFQITDEWTYRGTVYANRADVVFLINGIPIALAETKAADKKDGLEEGVAQVRRYHRETPDLLITPQLFEVTQLLDFFYGITWNTSRKSLFNWKEEEPGNYERKVKAFFDRARLLRVLRDYIVFLSRDDILSKMILRQHQTRAVEKALTRVSEPTKRRGLIWHTQGSGKTLTMITIASKLLREAPDGEKPTVLMIVDRNELESQLFRNITGYGITTLEVAESKRDLQKLLADDYRGLIVSMIHKFDDIPANVNLRSGVVVLVDEAHRTTGGDLGTYLLAALPNATYIGFTGTPIDKLSKGQGTFKVFGVDDEQGYLDKYNIAESVEDGTTVRLNYALAPSDLRVDREILEQEFLNLAERGECPLPTVPRLRLGQPAGQRAARCALSGAAAAGRPAAVYRGDHRTDETPTGMSERVVGETIGTSTTMGTWQDAEELRWAVRQWAARIGVRVARIQVRELRAKWASMSTAGNLTLSRELIALPRDLGEYVIVHELVHLLAPNHGKVFKSFMLAYLPDWEERERRLHSRGSV